MSITTDGETSDENPLYTANIIAVQDHPGRQKDNRCNQDLRRSCCTNSIRREGVEANVASGWHAIEFLLWGQDLARTGPGAGDRPWDRL